MVEKIHPRGFVMVKGDFSGEVFGGNGLTNFNEQKAHSWLTTFLETYAKEKCQTKIHIVKTKVVEGLTKEDLIEIYGEDHGRWMDSLTKDDFEQHMEVYDGTCGPIIMAIVEVPEAKNIKEAEKKLTHIRDTFREDWHTYLGEKEISLPGGSTLFLSALHVGDYDSDINFLNKKGLSAN